MAADRIWSDQKKGHNLLQKNTVIISTVKPTQNIEDVDCVLVPSVNYEAMKTYLELECAYVWGIEFQIRNVKPLTLYVKNHLVFTRWFFCGRSTRVHQTIDFSCSSSEFFLFAMC